MYGLDLERNLDKIRQNIGLCTQKDILYDYLTFKEHLLYFGSIKGLVGQELEAEVFSMIQKVQCEKE